MSSTKIYCGIISDSPDKARDIFAILQFISIALNKISAADINVHPVIGSENGKTCLFITIEESKWGGK